MASPDRAAAMYIRAFGWRELGRFEDHEGFDGVMAGDPALPYHLEFTHCRTHPVAPRTTEEDLLVFYLPDPAEWRVRCEAVLAAGFVPVEAFNPYWARQGRTFADSDGYRVVIQRSAWTSP